MQVDSSVTAAVQHELNEDEKRGSEREGEVKRASERERERKQVSLRHFGHHSPLSP